MNDAKTPAAGLAAALQTAGVNQVFGHPGGEVVDLIEALAQAGITFTLTGHESAAAFMAATVGRLTGQLVYDRQCSRCHESTGNSAAFAPMLRSRVNQPVANQAGYAYSPALLRLGGRWTPARLDAFLRDPRAYAPGTTMHFHGLASANERAMVVDYLGRRF